MDAHPTFGVGKAAREQAVARCLGIGQIVVRGGGRPNAGEGRLPAGRGEHGGGGRRDRNEPGEYGGTKERADATLAVAV